MKDALGNHAGNLFVQMKWKYPYKKWAQEYLINTYIVYYPHAFLFLTKYVFD